MPLEKKAEMVKAKQVVYVLQMLFSFRSSLLWMGPMDTGNVDAFIQSQRTPGSASF